MKTLIRNGMVCFEDRLSLSDVLVDNGTIADVRQGVPASTADEVIEAGGLTVLPGLIDIHTHLDDRIGPYELADTYESGTRVAVENGITTLFTFVTQQADESLTDAVMRAAQKAERRCHANYMWHLTPTRFDDQGWKDICQWIDRGFRTFKFYTTYKRAGICSDYDQLDALFGRLAPMGARFLVHCEDESVLMKALESKPNIAEAVSHALLRPAGAEIEAIRHVLRLAEKHNARVHIVHVSTPEGVDVVAETKPRAQVTCETAPQYVFLNENYLRGSDGQRWICSPPLRSEERRNALAARAAGGMVDLFATDHCAFRRKDKDVQTGDVRDVPNGLPGIGALPAMMLNLYQDRLPDGLVNYAQRLSTNPAKVTGVYPRKGTIAVGSDADLVLLRTDGSDQPIRSTHADAHEPYPDRTSRFHVNRVLLGGTTVVKDGALVAPEKPKGQCLCRW